MDKPLKIWFPIIPYNYVWNNTYYQDALRNVKDFYKCMYCDNKSISRKQVQPIQPIEQTVDLEPIIKSYNESLAQFGGALSVITDEYRKLYEVFDTEGIPLNIQGWFAYLRDKLGQLPDFNFQPTHIQLDNYVVPISQEAVELVQSIHDTIIIIYDAMVELEKMSIRDIDLYKLYQEA